MKTRKRNKILVFGDSIVYGQMDLEMGGWVNRLKLELANDSSIDSCHVFNMGISGQSTGEVLERIDSECGGRILEEASNLIILAVGINDSQVIDGEVLVDKATFRKNVRELIFHARNHTPRVVYLGLTPVDDTHSDPVSWDKTKSWKNDLVREYDKIIEEVCEEMDVRYIHVFDKLDPTTNADGLHPSAVGHEILADIMKEVVYDYINHPVTINEIAHPKGLAEVSGNFWKSILHKGDGEGDEE